MEPSEQVFQGRHHQKTQFPPQKNGQKKANFWPKSVFSRSGWSFCTLSSLFLGFPTQKNMCCMPLKTFNKSFRAVTTKKNLFRPKMSKECPFWAQISVFRVRVVTSCPLYCILKVLGSKKDVLHANEPIEQVLQGWYLQKKTIFRPKMAKKNANF